jgi:hypothetical protein
LIRKYEPRDFESLKAIHASSGLPVNCMPDLSDELFIVKFVAEENGRVVQGAFVKQIAEGFVLVDRGYGSPEKKWDILQELVTQGLHAARLKGIRDLSCWVPPKLEQTFAGRLNDLGFERSPWPSFSITL